MPPAAKLRGLAETRPHSRSGAALAGAVRGLMVAAVGAAMTPQMRRQEPGGRERQIASLANARLYNGGQKPLPAALKIALETYA